MFFFFVFFFDGYCSTVQGLLDWFKVDLGFTELSFIQLDLCVLCVFADMLGSFVDAQDSFVDRYMWAQ